MSWLAKLFRRLLFSLTAIVMLVTAAGSMSTSGVKVTSYTQVLSGTTNVFSFPAANPCGGEPRTIKLTSNGAFRITMLRTGQDAGNYWISPLQRGTFEIRPNRPDDPLIKGTFELLPDSNTTHKGELTFFLHLVGKGSDGSTLNTRLLERLDVSPDKVTISMAAPAFLAAQLVCA